VVGDPPGPRPPVRVLLVDEHELCRRGLAIMLEPERGVLLVGEAGGPEGLADLAGLAAPDVVLVDVGCARAGAVIAVQAVLPAARVVLLTPDPDGACPADLALTGVAATIPADCPVDELLAAVLGDELPASVAENPRLVPE
jgi:DNA-binding NarL/FixJ family response regulator